MKTLTPDARAALERAGFISRLPGQARSISLLVSPDSLPTLKPPTP